MLNSKDIAELEKKYFKYKLKKRLKLSVFIILLILIVGYIIFYIFNNSTCKQASTNIDKNQNKKIEEINNSIQPIHIKNTKIINSKKLIQKTRDINISGAKDINLSKKVTANIPTEKSINETNKSNIAKNKIEKKLVFHIYPSEKLTANSNKSAKLKLNLNFLKNTIAEKKPINISKNISTNDIIKKEDTSKKEPNIKTKIDIKINDIDSIAYLKNKFQKTHDIVFALMLCENYYSQKMYKKSLKWSMIANDIDNQSERSWIWFAKSKYRLNKRDDAIKALKAYLRSNDSKKIKFLLKDIINGEIYD